MNIINKILVPIDFSNSADNAINYVVGMAARDTKIKCFLYHVTNQSDAKVAEQKLLDIKRNLFDKEGVACEVLVAIGGFVEKLIEDRARLDIDLVIMGMADNPHGELSYTVELLQGADCPLLIIPSNVGKFRLDQIALALDENEFDDSTDLQVFHDFAKWFNAKVHLIKVDKDGNGGGAHALKNEDTIDYYMESLDYQYSFPKNENIEEGILNYVNDKEIDALAIMPRTHAQKTKPSKGRLTKVLAKHVNVPLLVLD